MILGRPSLADEFNTIGSRLGALEQNSSTRGEVLTFMPYPYGSTQGQWYACGFISTISLTQPVLRLDLRCAIRQGESVTFRLVDSDTGRTSAEALIRGLGVPAQNQWLQLTWRHGLTGTSSRRWHRMAMQIRANDGEMSATVDPGVAISLPLYAAGDHPALGAGHWEMIEKPLGFH
ncbi:hypothetical protein ACWDRR_00695 [Kitasatospora sp. NPDC003701]